MSAHDAVAMLVVDDLHPSHIHLRERAAAPLACLEHNQAYGLPRQAHILEHGKHAPLRRVEHQAAVAASDFVLHRHAGGAPVFKVVVEAQPVERLVAHVVADERSHCFGHQKLLAATVYGNALAVASNARNRVVGASQSFVAALVFSNDGIDADFVVVRVCVFHDIILY